MCVIIHKNAGTELPYEKLKSACIVNPDGFGLTWAEDGKMQFRRVFNDKGNDPEQLAKFLEDLKDTDTYLHLRFKTRGPKDLKNVHPFTALSLKQDGMDIQFMHNGTLGDFGTAEMCDSKEFAQSVVGPLAERIMMAVGPEEVLKDSVFRVIMEKYAGKGSVFLLADNYGNNLKIGEGYKFNGWWASNEYSFNRAHRESDWDPTAKGTGFYRNGVWVQRTGGGTTTPSTTTGTTQHSTKAPTLASVGSTATAPLKPDELPWDDDKAKRATASDLVKEAAANRNTAKFPTPETLPKRATFIEMAELDSLYDVCSLSRSHIEELVEEYPENAVALIQDLIWEVFKRDLAEEYDESEYAA